MRKFYVRILLVVFFIQHYLSQLKFIDLFFFEFGIIFQNMRTCVNFVFLFVYARTLQVYKDIRYTIDEVLSEVSVSN